MLHKLEGDDVGTTERIAQNYDVMEECPTRRKMSGDKSGQQGFPVSV